MKRFSVIAFSCLLCAALLLTGCANEVNLPAPDTEAPAQPSDPQQTPPASEPPVADGTDPDNSQQEDNEPVVRKETYLPETVATQLKTIFEGKQATFLAAAASEPPYALVDVYGVSNGRLLSITLPVVKTGATDADGNFLFSLYVMGNSLSGMKSMPRRAYFIRINAEQYGLTANNTSVYKWVKVDLSSYNIVLTADETLAMFSANDTIFPAYIGQDTSNTHAALNVLKQSAPQATGYFNNAGKDTLRVSQATMLYDFEFERTYTKQEYDAMLAEEAAYREMVTALKSAYMGKTVSILSDSLSTYHGISNDATANDTIGNNEVYYGNGSHNIYDYRYTWWGRLLTDTGMSLCVNNSWSGGRIYGTESRQNWGDNMLSRADQLHRNVGTRVDPDVIIVSYGTNDVLNPSAVVFGDLYEILQTNDGRTDREKIDAWLTDVVAQAATTSTVTPGVTYTTVEQAYALSLKKIKETYPNAELFCATVVQGRLRDSADQTVTDKYDTCIRALAEYFGATVLEVNSVITADNCHGYNCDTNMLHWTSYGHSLVERMIVKIMYEKLKEN